MKTLTIKKTKFDMMDYALSVILLLNFVLLGLFYQEIQVQQELMRQYMEQYGSLNCTTQELLLLKIQQLQETQTKVSIETAAIDIWPNILKGAGVGTLVVVFILLGLRFCYPPVDPQFIDDLAVETLTRLNTVNEIIIDTGNDIITRVGNKELTCDHLDKIEQKLADKIAVQADKIAGKHSEAHMKSWEITKNFHKLFVAVRRSLGKGPESGYDLGE